VRFVAFPATEYGEVLSGYQPGQMVERLANQRFEDPEEEDRDGVRNVGLLSAQPFDPADSPRELHHTLFLSPLYVIKD
jgi:hypothetical protein